MSRVAIAGYDIHGFDGETDKSSDEMLLPTSMAALEDAGITHEDLDVIVATGQDTYDGAAISDGQKVAPSGAYEKPMMRVQNGGGTAIHQAKAKILSGKADVITVVAADFVTSDPRVMSWAAQEALYHRPIGLNDHMSFGLLANHHLESRDVTSEDLARTAAKNYEAATANPHAHRQESHTSEDVLESDMVASPLTELMLGPGLSYGATVCVLVSEEVAQDLGGEYVWVTGSGLNSGSYRYWDLDRRLEQPTLRKAATTAYEEAGIESDDVDAAEIAAYAPTFELLSYEGLGFCDRDEGPELVADGVTAPDGELPVNVSGGPLATSPPNSGGLYRILMGLQLITGELGDVDAETVVVADNDMHLGEPARTDAVLVLEGVSA